MAAPEGEPVPQTPDKLSTAGIDALLDEMGAGDPSARPLALDELHAMGLDVPGPRTRLPRATRVGGILAWREPKPKHSCLWQTIRTSLDCRSRCTAQILISESQGFRSAAA